MNFYQELNQIRTQIKKLCCIAKTSVTSDQVIINQNTDYQSASFRISGSGNANAFNVRSAPSTWGNVNFYRTDSVTRQMALGIEHHTNIDFRGAYVTVGDDIQTIDYASTGPGYNFQIRTGYGGTNSTIWFRNGNIGIQTTAYRLTHKLAVNGAGIFLGKLTANNGFQIATPFTPTSSADATGEIGDITRDDDYLYQKTAAGWKRSAIFGTF